MYKCLNRFCVCTQQLFILFAAALSLLPNMQSSKMTKANTGKFQINVRKSIMYFSRIHVFDIIMFDTLCISKNILRRKILLFAGR